MKFQIFKAKENPFGYWEKRAKKHGRRSVYNMGHSVEELSKVDEWQEEIYLDAIKPFLSGNEATALDFGCGCGRFEPMLSKIAKKVYAIDPIKRLIKLAPKINNVEYKLFNGTNIPLEDNSIDFVFISLAVGGVHDVDTTIKEVCRVSKADALFFVCENTANLPDHGYWHYRTVEEYLSLFSFVDLKLVKQYEDLGEEISIMIGRKKCLQSVKN